MNDDTPTLIDTNILVYAFDKDEKEKHTKAKKILQKVIKGTTHIHLSTQNLSEFYVITTQKIEHPLTPTEAKEIISLITTLPNITIHPIQTQTILTAINLSTNHQHPYWDSLIAAVMQEHQVTHIITENEKDFTNIPWLTVTNPFN